MDPVSIFTTVKLLEFVVGGVVGTAATGLIQKAGNAIRNKLKTEPASSKNIELLRVTRIAYLRASLAVCRRLLSHGHGGQKVKGEAKRGIKTLERYLSNEINTARNQEDFRSAAFLKVLGQLQDNGPNTENRLEERLFLELQTTRIHPVRAFEDLLKDGWQEKGVHRSWKELMIASFQEEVAKNPAAKATLEQNIWQQVKNTLNDVQIDVKALTSHMEQVWQKNQLVLSELTEIKTYIKDTIEQVGQLAKGQQEIKASQKNIEKELAGQRKRIPERLGPEQAPPEIFLGREKDLKKLREQLESADQSGLLLVNGEGGIGKTSLAAYYYHQYESTYNHVAWISAANSINKGLLSLSYDLGLEFTRETETQRSERVLKSVSELKGTKLLIVDNANDLDDLRQHYDALRAVKRLHLIVTTRITEFREANILVIKGLSKTATITLFKNHYKKLREEEKSIVLSIREAVNANTLVIELLAKNLKKVNRYDQTYNLTSLLKDLQEKGLLQLAHSKEVETAYQNFKKAKPEDIISAMFDLYRLPPGEQQLLKCISLLPNESIPFIYMKFMLEEVENFEDALAALADKGWIEHDRKNQALKLSPVIQEVIKDKAKDLHSAGSPLLTRLTQVLAHKFVHLDNYFHTSRFVRYAENAVTSINETSMLLGELWQNINNYHYLTGDLNKCLWSSENMIRQFQSEFSKTPTPNNQDALAISFDNMGETQKALGNLDKALIYFRKAVKLMKSLSKDYPGNFSYIKGLAISYEKLGEINMKKGNLDLAHEYFNNEVILFEQLAKDKPESTSCMRALATTYARLGEIYSLFGNSKSALEYFNKQISVCLHILNNHPEDFRSKNSLSVGHSQLGNIYLREKKFDLALRHFELGLMLATQLFTEHPKNIFFKSDQARALGDLGHLYLILNNKERASKYFIAQNKLAKQLCTQSPKNIGFSKDLGRSFRCLGLLHLHADGADSADNAISYFLEERNLLKIIIKSHQEDLDIISNLATSSIHMGQAYLKKKNYTVACGYLLKAKKAWKHLLASFPRHSEFSENLRTVNLILEQVGCES